MLWWHVIMRWYVALRLEVVVLVLANFTMRWWYFIMRWYIALHHEVVVLHCVVTVLFDDYYGSN